MASGVSERICYSLFLAEWSHILRNVSLRIDRDTLYRDTYRGVMRYDASIPRFIVPPLIYVYGVTKCR